MMEYFRFCFAQLAEVAGKFGSLGAATIRSEISSIEKDPGNEKARCCGITYSAARGLRNS